MVFSDAAWWKDGRKYRDCWEKVEIEEEIKKSFEERNKNKGKIRKILKKNIEDERNRENEGWKQQENLRNAEKSSRDQDWWKACKARKIRIDEEIVDSCKNHDQENIENLRWRWWICNEKPE